MFWANFLHFYQPPNQLADILERIVNESYRPIILGMQKNSDARLSININAGLTELLRKNKYNDVIDNLRKLAEDGKVEFIESAKYHAFLPMLPESSIIRQIKVNNETNRKFFGKAYNPQGFFSPEMAYHFKVAKIANRLGYKWMLADGLSFNGKQNQADYSKIYTISGLSGFKIFFKDQTISNLIVNAIVRSGRSLLNEIKKENGKNRYLLTAMDGETFGHHRPGLDKLLFDIFASPVFKKILISQITDYFPTGKAIKPIHSSWSSNEEDIKNSNPFKLWNQKNNPIHRLQWKFTYFVINEVEKLSHNSADYKRARKKLDLALHSCQFWWASKFWWSLEIIEQGVFNMRDTIFSVKSASKKIRQTAENYYRQILDIAFGWQRSGHIREFHKVQEEWQKKPFKERTHAEWYNQMILEFDAEMRKAAKNQEYEKAIKWRDAIIKLRSGADVYDVLHIVNELHSARKIPSAKPFLQQKKFTKFAKEYFLPLD